MKQIIYIFCCLAVSLGLAAQTVTKNYILTRTYTKDDGATSLDQIQYFDGLGRPIQTVQKAITPNSADLVTYTEYDGIGRDSIQWLPTPKAGNNGAFVDLSTFKTEAASQYGGSEKPYVTIKYEDSPLNRVTEQFGAGNDWYLNNKRNRTLYEANDGNIAYFYVNTSNSLVRGNNYPTGTLYKTVSFDEDNKSVTEYKDKLGQVVMKRSDTNVDTYFVYNDLRQLSYVIPPIAVDSLPSNGNIDDNNGVLRRYSYLYKYDERGNCIQKRLPGCDWIYMVYDKADRLILSQDGNQRQSNKWILNKYDNLGRVLYTSEITMTGALSSLIASFKQYVVTETFTLGSQSYPMSDTGYSRGWYHAVPCSLLTVNYYDNYDFLQKLSQSVQTNLAYTANNGYGMPHSSAKGLLTGTRTYILDGSGAYSTTAMYYDSNGQVVQTRSTNHLGGYDIVYNAYDFTGHVTKNLKTHNIQDKTPITELYDYTYDHAGRLLTTWYTLNDQPVLLVDQSQIGNQTQAGAYDELGRLRIKKRHGGVDMEEFDYNIRNWATRIKSGEFEEKLYYNTFPSMFNDVAYKQFNGNISASTWTYGNSLNGYQYNYDRLNRYTGGYSIIDGIVDIDYKFSEWYGYDKMGNILSLTRWDNYDTTDQLTLTYNGNQLKNVNDAYASRNQLSIKEYQDKAQNGYNYSVVEMTYDANGNLASDLDRDIVTIKYNLLNLPDVIQFRTGDKIINTYSASGQKLKSEYYTYLLKTTVPLSLSVDQIDNSPYSSSTFGYSGTAYVGNTEYGIAKTFINQYGGYYLDKYALIKLYNAEGYADGTIISNETNYKYGIRYNYFRKDHLGSNREVWSSDQINNSGTIPAFTAQRTQYYPSGLPWPSNTGDNPGLENKKYNGKEFVEMHGLDVTDLGNRGVYHATNRFTTIDRFAEKYPSQSPYVHAGNNPVNYVDVNGDSIWISVEINNSIERYYYGKDADGNYGFIGSNGKLYLGDDSFANSLSTALGQLINGGDVGTDLVTYLMNSTNNLDIVPNIKNSADFDNAGYIYWNPNNNKEGGLNKFGNNERPAFIGLAHEMAHIRDSWKGTIDKSIWMSAAELGTEKNVYNAEKYATDIENRIRAENGITLREYYSSTAFPQLRLINNKGRNNFYNHLYYNTIKIGTENFRFIWNH